MTVRAVDRLGFDTRQVHAGQNLNGEHGARITPIYLSNGFLFDDFDQAADRMTGRTPSYIYSRNANPTNSVAEAGLASLDGGSSAILVGSGQAAIAVALLALVGAGDHVLVAPSIYEGTRELFRTDMARLGIEFEFVLDSNDVDDWRRRIRPSTKAFFAETIPNPKNEILDIEPVTGLAHEHGIPVVIDNTIATPYLIRPIEHGADIVVYSTSKLLTGHGASIGGAIVDAGRFDWRANVERFPQFHARTLGSSGESFLDAFEGDVFSAYARGRTAASYGPHLSPLHAFLLLQGVETLSLRVAKHVANAQAIAEFLDDRPEVASVDYAGLPSSPHHALAERYLPRGAGSVFAFTLAGGLAAARQLYDHVGLFSRMTHIGDTRSLILHPGTTTHARLTPDERARAGIHPGLLRLSIGIESVDDLISDLEGALEHVR